LASTGIDVPPAVEVVAIDLSEGSEEELSSCSWGGGPTRARRRLIAVFLEVDLEEVTRDRRSG
jgi:hypothetical protein